MDTTDATPLVPAKRDRSSAAVRALLEPHREILLERIAAGERLADISVSLGLGLDRRRLSEALRGDPDYTAAIEAGHAARLDKAEKMVEEADADRSADVARARAYWAAVAWRAEREAPHRWGQKIESRTDASLTIQVIRHSDPHDVVSVQLGAVQQPALEAPET